MSFRSWLLITASGLVALTLAWFSWVMFSTYQQNHANERNDAAQHYASATDKGVNSCRAVMDESGVFDWLACVVENVSADGGVKQAEYDLKAQQDMAVWALGMLIVTLWLSAITLVGVVFVGWTLGATKATTKAAIDANKALKLAQRPWLTVEIAHKGDIELTERGFTEDGKLLGEVWLVIKNSGGASTVVTAIYRRWTVCNRPVAFPEPVPPGGKCPSGGKRKYGAVPISGGGISGPIKTRYADGFNPSLLAEGSAVFFDGYVEFQDLDGNKYVSGFCITFNHSRFHAAWPHRNPEKYHYHYQLEQVA